MRATRERAVRGGEWRRGLAAAAALGAVLTGCQGTTIDGATTGFDTARAFERLKTLAGTYDVEFPLSTDHSTVIWDNV